MYMINKATEITMCTSFYWTVFNSL